jgi:hypothetical protein
MGKEERENGMKERELSGLMRRKTEFEYINSRIRCIY